MNWEQAKIKLIGIPCLCEEAQGRILFEATQKLPDNATILEIGAWKGYSTCAIGLACIGTHRHIYTIDNFCGIQANTNIPGTESYLDKFTENITRLELLEYVTAFVGKSEEYYASWDKPLDMLWIDGDHNIMQQDFDAFDKWLKVGGTLVMHDIYKGDNRNFAQGMQYHNNMGWKIK